LPPLSANSEFSLNASDRNAGMELWVANTAGQPTLKATAIW